jgi:hypothetical protein
MRLRNPSCRKDPSSLSPYSPSDLRIDAAALEGLGDCLEVGFALAREPERNCDNLPSIRLPSDDNCTITTAPACGQKPDIGAVLFARRAQRIVLGDFYSALPGRSDQVPRGAKTTAEAASARSSPEG